MSATVAVPPRGGAWLQTTSGGAWLAESPEAYDYDAHEIGHALSCLGRFAGHAREFYSVAQHSVHVAEIATTDERTRGMNGSEILQLGRLALLHDAAEAFCVDMPAPIKRMPEMEGYRHLIARVERAICARFASQIAMQAGGEAGSRRRLHDAIVAHADLVALATEKRDLLGPTPWDDQWQHLPPANVRVIRALDPMEASLLFCDAWDRYGGAR